jgi:hypothetical protein
MKFQYYNKTRWGLAPLAPNDAPPLLLGHLGVHWAGNVLRTVALHFFFNCCYLEIPSDNRIRHVPRRVHYHAQGLQLETS